MCVCQPSCVGPFTSTLLFRPEITQFSHSGVNLRVYSNCRTMISDAKLPETAEGADSNPVKDPGNLFQSFLVAIKNKPKKNTYVKRIGPSGAELLSAPRKQKYVNSLSVCLSVCLSLILTLLLALRKDWSNRVGRSTEATKAERADRMRRHAARKSFSTRGAFIEYLGEKSRALSNRIERGRKASKEAIENLCHVSAVWTKLRKAGKGKMSAEEVKAGMAALVKQGGVEGDEQWRERKRRAREELDRVVKEEEGKRTTGEKLKKTTGEAKTRQKTTSERQKTCPMVSLDTDEQLKSLSIEETLRALRGWKKRADDLL